MVGGRGRKVSDYLLNGCGGFSHGDTEIFCVGAHLLAQCAAGQVEEDGFQVGFLQFDAADVQPKGGDGLKDGGQASVGIIHGQEKVAAIMVDGAHAGQGGQRGGRQVIEGAFHRQVDAFAYAGGADEFIQRAFGNQLPLVEDADAVAEFLGFFHVMRGVEHGEAGAVEFLDRIENAAAALRVDAHGWLVQEQDFGAVEQAHRDVQSALHSTGVRRHLVIGAPVELRQVEGLVHAGFERASAQAEHAPPKAQVLTGGQVVVQGDFLRHDTDDFLHLVGLSANREPPDGDFPLVGAQQGGQHADGGSFAGPVGT